MAVTVGDKTYRNLPEQVEENANNIQWLLDIIQSFGNVMRYCGSVAIYADLPTEDNRVGDVWNVLDTGNNYAWDGEAWDEISSIVDLSGYVTKIGCPLPYISANLTDGVQSTFQANGVTNNKPFILCFSNNSSYLAIYYKSGGIHRFTLLNLKDYHITTWSYWTYPSTFASVFSDGKTKSIVTSSELDDYSHKWIGAYVGDESVWRPDHQKVGDIIMESTVGQYLINDITFDAYNNLTKVILVGLEDNGNPVVHKFENNDWSSSNYVEAQLATKANTADVVNLTGDQNITGNKRSTSASGNTAYFEFVNSTGAGFRIYTNAYGQLLFDQIYNNNDVGNVFNFSGNQLIHACNLQPNNDNSRKIGDSSHRYKEIYVSDFISDGSNSVTPADLANLIAYAKAQGWIS